MCMRRFRILGVCNPRCLVYSRYRALLVVAKTYTIGAELKRWQKLWPAGYSSSASAVHVQGARWLWWQLQQLGNEQDEQSTQKRTPCRACLTIVFE